MEKKRYADAFETMYDIINANAIQIIRVVNVLRINALRFVTTLVGCFACRKERWEG